MYVRLSPIVEHQLRGWYRGVTGRGTVHARKIQSQRKATRADAAQRGLFDTEHRYGRGTCVPNQERRAAISFLRKFDYENSEQSTVILMPQAPGMLGVG